MRKKTFKSAPNLANAEDGAHLDVVACGFVRIVIRRFFWMLRFLEVTQTGEGEAEEM